MGDLSWTAGLGTGLVACFGTGLVACFGTGLVACFGTDLEAGFVDVFFFSTYFGL